jgi:hypothetical protein
MKKLISILIVSLLSLFVVNSQSDVKYIDSLKSVTVSVSSDSQNQILTQNDLQFAKTVENQNVVNEKLVVAVNALETGVTAITKEVEKRNKSDSTMLTELFGYTNPDVKRIIQRQRGINLITWSSSLIYIIFVLTGFSPLKYGDNKPWPVLLIQCFVWLTLGVVYFLLVQNLLTLIFNKHYFIIKELSNLFT